MKQAARSLQRYDGRASRAACYSPANNKGVTSSCRCGVKSGRRLTLRRPPREGRTGKRPRENSAPIDLRPPLQGGFVVPSERLPALVAVVVVMVFVVLVPDASTSGVRNGVRRERSGKQHGHGRWGDRCEFSAGRQKFTARSSSSEGMASILRFVCAAKLNTQN